MRRKRSIYACSQDSIVQKLIDYRHQVVEQSYTVLILLVSLGLRCGYAGERKTPESFVDLVDLNRVSFVRAVLEGSW